MEYRPKENEPRTERKGEKIGMMLYSEGKVV
jgi:hypothetical protein